MTRLVAFALGLVALPAAAQSEVELRLRLAETSFDVGDVLELELEVHNGTRRAVEIVTPVYGSWEHAREPAYDTILTDPTTGAVVENALGYEDGLDCGVLGTLRRHDRIALAPGATSAVPTDAGSDQQQRVLATARPGTYALRVRYRRGALTLLSNPVTIRVVGGDLALWECRRRQLDALASFREVQSRALGVADLPGSEHTLAVFTRHVHDAATDARTVQLWARALDARFQPVGSAARLFEARELGYPPALAVTSRGVLVAAVQDARGAERPMLREVRWQSGALSVGPEQVLPIGGGLGLALTAHGERAWLLQGDILRGPLRLWPLDAAGSARGQPIEAVASDEHTGGGLVTADATGAWVVHRSRAEQRLVAIRFDASGRAVARTPALAPGGEPTALRADGDRLEITWRDNDVSSDPGDGMGLRHGVFTRRGRLVEARALSPIERNEPRWGRAAWSDDQLGFAFAEERGAVIFGTGDVRRELSPSGAEVQLAPVRDGWIASWNDTRDDRSSACVALRQCASEVYVARLDRSGQVRVGATRITNDAVSSPPRPDERDWQRLCR